MPVRGYKQEAHEQSGACCNSCDRGAAFGRRPLWQLRPCGGRPDRGVERRRIAAGRRPADNGAARTRLSVSRRAWSDLLARNGPPDRAAGTCRHPRRRLRIHDLPPDRRSGRSRLPRRSRADHPDRTLHGRTLRAEIRGNTPGRKHFGKLGCHRRSRACEPERPAQCRAFHQHFPVGQRAGRRRRQADPGLSGPLREFRSLQARRSHAHQYRQDGFRPRAIGRHGRAACDDAGESRR